MVEGPGLPITTSEARISETSAGTCSMAGTSCRLGAMSRKLGQRGAHRLEGLCDGAEDGRRGAGNRIRIGSGSAGIERLEARLEGQAVAPHRHETHAIGLTLSGGQTLP